MDEFDEESRPWYAAGLYRRVQERRRWRPERAPRKPWRQRLRERGLHWNVELVVGAFVAVVVAAFATIAIAGPGVGIGASARGGAAGSPLSTPVATPTPDCIAAPIPGSARRVCTAP
jgi:predicted anti-sigma-YlaC factor YlaD